MNVKTTVLFFLIGIFDHVFASSHIYSLSKLSAQYYDISEKIHDVIDDIFLSLKLGGNATKSEYFAGLLEMYRYLESVISKIHKKHDEIPNITKISIDSKIEYYISNINKVIQDIDETENNMNRTENENDEEHKNNLYFYKLDERSMLQATTKAIIPNSSVNFTDNKMKLSKPKQKVRLRNLKLWNPNPFLSNRRIFKGNNASIEDFPFMASIHILGIFSCAGSIIHKKLVLTAASCLNKYYPTVAESKSFRHEVDVRVGTELTDEDGVLIPVTDVFFHPQFDPDTLQNNLLILRIGKALRFKPTVLRRVRTDTAAQKLPPEVNYVTVLGWGANGINEERTFKKPLSYASLDIYDLEECSAIYSSVYVTYTNVCAGYVSKGSGACNKDIGGPAIADHTLVGVISFGSPLCGLPDAPTVFTKVGYYAKWIDTVTKQVNSEKKINLKKHPKLNILGQRIGEETTTKAPDDEDNPKNEMLPEDEANVLTNIIKEIIVNKQINVTIDNFDNNNAVGVTPMQALRDQPLFSGSPELFDHQKTTRAFSTPNNFAIPEVLEGDINWENYKDFINELLSTHKPSELSKKYVSSEPDDTTSSIFTININNPKSVENTIREVSFDNATYYEYSENEGAGESLENEIPSTTNLNPITFLSVTKMYKSEINEIVGDYDSDDITNENSESDYSGEGLTIDASHFKGILREHSEPKEKKDNMLITRTTRSKGAAWRLAMKKLNKALKGIPLTIGGKIVKRIKNRL